MAWVLGAAAAVLCVIAAGLSIWLDVPRSFLLVFAIGVLLGLLGGLVAARAPRNKIGWLMIAWAWIAGADQVVSAYGYAALGINHGTWPLGSLAAWLGAWIWVPSVGFIALISVRFPDGVARRFRRTVDWTFAAGTLLFAFAISVAPPAAELGFTPIPGEKLALMLPFFNDPIPFHPSLSVRAQVQGIGLILVLVANVIAAASLYVRYRGERGDERLQIKWFAYAGALCALAIVGGAAAYSFFSYSLFMAFTPLELVALGIPISIGIAILRYRLYDIDLIINRTLVYGGLTAILGAVYAAIITLLNRLFISVSGQKSDAAYVVTAFVVVVAALPVKDWLQHQADRRIRHASPASVLDQFRSDVEAVVSVMDVERVARRLLDQAIEAFDARGAALYLDGEGTKPAYTRGHLNGEAEVEVTLAYEERQFGRLVLGTRRGDIAYTAHDRAALQKSADSVGEAFALASHLGFRPLSKAH